MLVARFENSTTGRSFHCVLEESEAKGIEAFAPLKRLLRARMANDRETRLTVDIPAQDVLSVLVRHLPFTIQCVRGSIWITHPADPGDHTLSAGDSFEASGPGHLLIVALDPSRVVIARGPAKTTWSHRIQRALPRRAKAPVVAGQVSVEG